MRRNVPFVNCNGCDGSFSRNNLKKHQKGNHSYACNLAGELLEKENEMGYIERMLNVNKAPRGHETRGHETLVSKKANLTAEIQTMNKNLRDAKATASPSLSKASFKKVESSPSTKIKESLSEIKANAFVNGALAGSKINPQEHENDSEESTTSHLPSKRGREETAQSAGENALFSEAPEERKRKTIKIEENSDVALVIAELKQKLQACEKKIDDVMILNDSLTKRVEILEKKNEEVMRSVDSLQALTAQSDLVASFFRGLGRAEIQGPKILLEPSKDAIQPPSPSKVIQSSPSTAASSFAVSSSGTTNPSKGLTPSSSATVSSSANPPATKSTSSSSKMQSLKSPQTTQPSPSTATLSSGTTNPSKRLTPSSSATVSSSVNPPATKSTSSSSKMQSTTSSQKVTPESSFFEEQRKAHQSQEAGTFAKKSPVTTNSAVLTPAASTSGSVSTSKTVASSSTIVTAGSVTGKSLTQRFITGFIPKVSQLQPQPVPSTSSSQSLGNSSPQSAWHQSSSLLGKSALKSSSKNS